MEALSMAIITTVPNLAGFLMLSLSNNRTISKLFAQLRELISNSESASGKKIAILEAKVSLLEGLLKLPPAAPHNGEMPGPSASREG